MARPELERIILRSRSPLPRPAETVRIPVASRARSMGAVGGLLGMFLLPLAMIPLPLGTLSSDAQILVAGALFAAGAGLGVGIGMVLGAPCRRGRAIAFDADGIWCEEGGVATVPLPWPGLRLRAGRTSTLVAEDGRTLRIDDYGNALTGDVCYLVALLHELPKLPPRPSVPTWLIAAILGAGVACVCVGADYRPPLDAEGPYWSPDRYRFVIGVVLGAILVVGALFPLMIRVAIQSGSGSKSSIPAASVGADLAEHFRSHRFRPPAVDLQAGQTYRYRAEEFWRAEEKPRHRSRTTLALLAPVLATPYVVIALTTPEDGRGGRLAYLGIAAFILAFLGGTALFTRVSRRAEFRLEIEGERARVSYDGRREAVFPWPPTRVREATRLDDWTDELRDSGRRLRLDRRLLVPVDESDPSWIKR